MSFQDAPDRFLKRDVIKAFVSSRGALAILFSLFLGVGVACVWQGETIFVSIGTSLLASAMISLATLLIDQIRSGEQLRASALAQAGLLAAYERRDLPEYDAQVRASSEIDIAGYTLKSFAESNVGTLKERASNGRAVIVRVLIVDPSCGAAQTLELREGLAPGSYAGTFHSLQDRLGKIQGVSIRVLSHALPMMIYRIDGVLYTGPFPSDGLSRVAPTLKLGSGGWLFQRHRQEFDTLWEQGRPVDLESSANTARELA